MTSIPCNGPARRACTAVSATAAAAAAALLASPAQADVTNRFYADINHYDYRVTHMTDLDQRRSLLPNNGGMHCVPTASINLYCYAANHGFAWVGPGPGNYESSGQYSNATSAIMSMGALMGTSGVTGTNGSGLTAGMDIWNSAFGFGLVTRYRLKSSNYTPAGYRMAKMSYQGWLLSFIYGRYSVMGSIGGNPNMTRTGGHAVTLVRNYRNGSTRLIRYRDPADGASLTSQSAFVDKKITPSALTGYYGDSLLRTLTVIDYPQPDGVVRAIDGYFGVRPLFGLKFVNTGLQGGGGTIELLEPGAFTGGLGSGPAAIQLDSSLTIDELALYGDLTDAVVVAHKNSPVQPATLRMLDLATGELADMPGAPTGLAHVAVSREDHIYVSDAGGKVYKLDMDGQILLSISSAPLPARLAFDDKNDLLYVLSMQQRKVARFDRSLGFHSQVSIPETIPMSGPATMSIDPTTGRAWWMTKGSPQIYNVVLNVAGGVTVSTITPPVIPGGINAIQFGDHGELYLIGDGAIKVLRNTGEAWIPDTDSPFNDMPGGAFLMMATSNSNVDRAVHDGPEWNNVPPELEAGTGVQVADCIHDLNGDDMVDGIDLGILLGAWGQGSGASDINQDGVVDGADLGQLLGAWGPCP